MGGGSSAVKFRGFTSAARCEVARKCRLIVVTRNTAQDLKLRGVDKGVDIKVCRCLGLQCHGLRRLACKRSYAMSVGAGRSGRILAAGIIINTWHICNGETRQWEHASPLGVTLPFLLTYTLINWVTCLLAQQLLSPRLPPCPHHVQPSTTSRRCMAPDHWKACISNGGSIEPRLD